jgi:small-conductance mechanosensitive channel
MIDLWTHYAWLALATIFGMMAGFPIALLFLAATKPKAIRWTVVDSTCRPVYKQITGDKTK